MHGYGVVQRIQQVSDDAPRVEEGSLYRPFTGWNKQTESAQIGRSPTVGGAPNITN
jgi:hypothetical protein